MPANDPLPDHLRCKRTDGRQWRCNRRVMEDKKLCEIHHLQGRHRQHKTKVPETLKIQREYKRKSNPNADSEEPNWELRAQKVKLGKSIKRKKSVGDSVGESVKLKRGDLQLELIQMVLNREVEKRNKKKKKKKKKKTKVAVQRVRSDDDNDGFSSNSEGEYMRDLPNGLMAISPAKHFSNGGAGGAVASSSSSPCDVKIGGSDFNSVTRRCFRSKNIEPMPIGAMQVVPFKKDLVRLRRGKRKKCHLCRRSGVKTLIRCSSCRKQFYCLDCIKDQYFDMQEEVKIACPVCRGTCGCKICTAIRSRDVECKDLSTDKSRVNKVLHFHYLICMLLPVLKKINQDQSIEIELEAKIIGREPSDVEIQQAEGGCNNQCSCCKTSILDFHRRCSSCSYNLCLSCCRDILQISVPGSVKSLLSKYPNRRKTWLSSHPHFEIQSECNLKRNNASKYSDSFLSWEILDDHGGVPCPPSKFGGCGVSLLNLSSIYPSSWVKQLEVDSEEIVGCYELPETVDVFSRCLLCVGTDCEVNGSMQVQEAAQREDSNDNYLYYPTVVDIHNDLEHFQKHWGKGQPVIVRNVLQGTSDLSWDPIVMFCTYLKNNAAKSDNERAADCYDWFEVEIGVKQLFMGSFRGPKHASMWHERLKLKGWLSSHLFQEHFPAHYAELLNALPLPDYMDPVSGVLNIPTELPHNISKPDLGPCVYISYGSGDNHVQADSVMKLRYDSYDVVNILAHATDVPVSMEQLNYIRKLMRKHKEQNEASEAAGSVDEQNLEEVGLQDLMTEQTNLHKKVSKVSWFSAANNKAHASRRKNRHMYLDGEDGSDSDSDSGSDSDSDSDTDTDTEVSKFFFGPLKASRTLENHKFCGKHTESLNGNAAESCGAEWDVFRRQDVPKLVEYLRRHSNEFNQTYVSQKHMSHPILDQNYFLDTAHKMRLKEEFKIEPWSFEQHVGEAIIIPAGCPYQVRNLKSCVNVVLDFLSPENVTECIQLVDELRLLPKHHKAKEDCLEVKKMALFSISKAIKEIRELTSCADNDRQ
ncbi:Transcription factor jumonji (jmjC) domain-containing protein [Euphorbia peplus]|nr:Transcription factor jumonji (jmjC) domain-containing protein [Euphorbia peplus]